MPPCTARQHQLLVIAGMNKRRDRRTRRRSIMRSMFPSHLLCSLPVAVGVLLQRWHSWDKPVFFLWSSTSPTAGPRSTLTIIYSIFTKQQLINLYTTTCTIYSCLARSNMHCIGKQYSTPIRRVCTWREHIGIEIYIRCALYIIQTNNMCTYTHACVWIMFIHTEINARMVLQYIHLYS